MSWLTFGTATSPEPMAFLDQQFNNVASGMSLPCTATGTNAISLTPLSSFPSLSSYNELGGYRFVAASTTTAAVTLQYNGLGLLPAYKADGVTQCNVGDIVAGEQYIATFHQALNGGGGGFYIESPSISAVVNSSQFTPGGRLTLQSAVPVMFTNQLAQQTIFYAPYVHPLVPVYNGSIVQMVQFTSSLSDQVGLSLSLGGGAQWTNNLNFDLFVTLIGATPTLVGVPWTNNTTRATTLAIFAGFLTNSGSCTAFTGPATSVTMPANQGTFVGSFHTSAAGQTQWQFGGSASGGTAAFFNLANYYNQVLFTTGVIDSGAAYTYTSSTTRQARASTGNQINFLQTSSERAIIASYINAEVLLAVGGAHTDIGIGVNSTTSFSAVGLFTGATGALFTINPVEYKFSFTGYGFIAAVEAGDNVNANNFNDNSLAQLQASLWL